MKGRIAALAVVMLTAPFVAEREGVVTFKYADPIGVPTVCAGETDREVVSLKSVYTRDECVAVMGASLYAHALELEKCVKRPIKRQEAAAILSWSYNVGVGNACGSTLMRKLNAGQPFCAELSKWVYAAGIKLGGLVKRREAERHMCETGSWK